VEVEERYLGIRAVTVPSQISQHLFLNETLTEADLTKSRLGIAAIATLQHLADNGGIGLTKSGAFARKFIVRAVDQFDWPGYTAKERAVANKVLNEDDVLPLSRVHELLRVAKIIRHANNGRGSPDQGRHDPPWLSWPLPGDPVQDVLHEVRFRGA
jgi:hypothetical protein